MRINHIGFRKGYIQESVDVSFKGCNLVVVSIEADPLLELPKGEMEGALHFARALNLPKRGWEQLPWFRRKMVGYDKVPCTVNVMRPKILEDSQRGFGGFSTWGVS